jgi:hypothetical protein
MAPLCLSGTASHGTLAHCHLERERRAGSGIRPQSIRTPIDLLSGGPCRRRVKLTRCRRAVVGIQLPLTLGWQGFGAPGGHPQRCTGLAIPYPALVKLSEVASRLNGISTPFLGISLDAGNLRH